MNVNDLIRQGYKSVSRRYRRLARLPPRMSGLEAIRVYAPDFYETLQRQAEMHFLRVYATDHVDLAPEEYEAFRAAGGESA